MRLGGVVFRDCSDPEKWVEVQRHYGYTAAYCPLDASASDDTVRAYAAAAERAGLVVAEVGAWSNPMGPDEAKRKEALAHCQAQLDLAERIGARCCVNIAGSRGEQWDGPDPANLTAETFDAIVECVRTIIDAVNPTRTFYTLETMPWMYPDSPESYVKLIDAIDRKGFAVHLDPVNLICSPQRYFGSGYLIRECFRLLGPRIRSCHAKDIALSGKLTTHLDEVRPGLGGMDYAVFLREIERADPQIPLMLEHLPTEEEYAAAAAFVRAKADELEIAVL